MRYLIGSGRIQPLFSCGREAAGNGNWRHFTFALAAAGLATALAQPVQARPVILSDWDAQYPTSLADENAAGAGSACQLCHVSSSGGGVWNAYGWNVRETLLAMSTADNIAAFLAVEALNSDGDPGVNNNLDEISGDTQPGWTLGSNNTTYNKDGTSNVNVAPPAGMLGLLDPVVVTEADIDLSPSAVDFGLVLTGSSTTSQVEILNKGLADLTVTGIGLCAGTSTEFSFALPTPVTLATGQASALDLIYAPIDVGADTGCVEISSNDPDQPTAQIPLDGEVVAAFIDVDVSSLAVSRRINLDRAGEVSIAVSVINAGAIQGDVDIAMVGAQNGVGVYSETRTVASGAPGATTNVSFPAFAPDRLGQITWTATVTDTDPDVDQATATTKATSRFLGEPLDDPIRMVIRDGNITINLELVTAGLVNPNSGIAAPVAILSDYLFVADQVGTVWRVDLDTGAKTVFADVSDVLVPLGIFGAGTFDERGLLGIAFHPDYASNGLFYTYTSEPLDGTADFSTMPAGTLADHQSVISEWTVLNPTEFASVFPDARRVLLRVDQPQFNHDGGGIAFGPDGDLYIAFGDGGGGGDQDGQPFIGGPTIGHGGAFGNGQDVTNPLGAILRIEPTGNTSTNGQYGIPADNPFVSQPGPAKEIYAYGLRNPYRISFDSLTGQLWTGDVGENDLEEVNVIVWGGNYGWKLLEGSFVFDDNGAGPGYVTDQDPATIPGTRVGPIAEYDHDEGLSAIGGYVYRGSAIPELSGRYVFGDWSLSFAEPLGRLFYIDPVRNRIAEFKLADRPALGAFVNGFGQDAAGEIYVMVGETGTPFGTTGAIYRIAPAP